jgi:SAM-dependent methyltransferase
MRGVEQIPWAYDLFMGIVERCGLGGWRRDLIGGAHGRSLELGCGTGRNFALYPAATTVFGLELDIQLLQRARRRGPEVPLVVGSAAVSQRHLRHRS